MTDYLNKFSLKGKTVFVCGGSGLLGSEISKAVSSVGAQTVILDTAQVKGKALAKKIKKEGCAAVYEPFNVAQLEKMESSLRRLSKKYKGVDVWVNASYPRTADWGEGIERRKLNSFRKNIDMHLNAYGWSSRAMALLMKENKIHGSIINIGSIYGVQANDFTVYEGTKLKSPFEYSMIKGGISNMTRYLASYFGKYKIRANCICPGGILDSQNKIFVKNYEKKVPLKRMGRPEDVASAVVYLASEASSYITGSNLMVDGGWTVV